MIQIQSVLVKATQGFLLTCVVFLSSSILDAARSSYPSSLKLDIEPGGHWFYTHYKLRVGQSSPPLRVKMVAGSYATDFIKHEGAGVSPRPFAVKWYFNVQKIKRMVEIYPVQSGYEIINLERNMKPRWYPVFQLFATKVAHPYILLDKGENSRHHLENSSANMDFSKVQPLPDCKFETLDNVCIVSYLSPRSPLARAVLVRVYTQLKKDKKGKKRPVARAVFCTKRGGGPRSTIKFVQTKNGFQEISRKRIHRSSIWYPLVKKVVGENLKKYNEFRQIHRGFVKAYRHHKKQGEVQ